MILDIQYIRHSEVPSLPQVKKILALAEKHLQIKTQVGNTVTTYNLDFRLSGVTKPGTIGVSPNGHSDILYQYFVSDDDLEATVVCPVPGNTALPVPLNQRKTISTFPATLFLATGESATIEQTTTTPNWIPAALTTAAAKALAVEAIKAWRNQKQQWLLEAPEYADLLPNIVTHLGYWLRSADYVIKLMWDQAVAGTLDASGSSDWIYLQKIVKEATKGPLTLDADGDGHYDVAFFRRLKNAVALFPNGPGFGALWVRTWDLSSVLNIDRVADFTADVLQTHGGTVDRTYHNMPSSYDSTADYWS